MTLLTATLPAPLDKGSKLEELVTKIRVRKGLKVLSFSPSTCSPTDQVLQPEIPPLDTYYDKL